MSASAGPCEGNGAPLTSRGHGERRSGRRRTCEYSFHYACSRTITDSRDVGPSPEPNVKQSLRTTYKRPSQTPRGPEREPLARHVRPREVACSPRSGVARRTCESTGPGGTAAWRCATGDGVHAPSSKKPLPGLVCGYVNAAGGRSLALSSRVPFRLAHALPCRVGGASLWPREAGDVPREGSP